MAINQGVLASIKVGAYTKADGTRVSEHYRNIIKQTDDRNKKEGREDKYIYKDFENTGTISSQKTPEQLREEFGAPLSTEIIFGRPTVYLPQLVDLEIKDIGKRILDKKFESLKERELKIDDLEIVQLFVFEKSLAKSKEKAIFVIDYKNKKYVLDGNHALAKAYLDGKKTIKAKVVKLKGYG